MLITLVNLGGKYPKPPRWRFLLAIDLAIFWVLPPTTRFTEQMAPLLRVWIGKLSDWVISEATMIAHRI